MDGKEKQETVICQVCGAEIEKEKKVQFVADLWRRFDISEQVVASRVHLCQRCRMEATVKEMLPSCLYVLRDDVGTLLQILNEHTIQL